MLGSTVARPADPAATARMAVARAALAQVEQRTGARQVGLADPARTPVASLITSERPPLPVPSGLAPLLPEGLQRGAVTSVLGSSWLVLGLIAHACGDGAWAAVVGHPDLGLLAAARAGVPLDRLALVPDPGEQAPTVLAALLDGVGLVVAGPQLRLSGDDARRLAARARERGTALLCTTPWSGAQVVLRAGRPRWDGLGQGTGRLRGARVHVDRAGVGAPAGVDLTLPLPVPAGPPSLPGAPTARLRLAG